MLAVLALVITVAALATATLVRAQGDLPPRPDAPTSVPDTSDDNKGDMQTGRITGTIIDSATGAPTPGVTVYVGGLAVRSDANGNYVRDGLAPGAYLVLIWLYPRVAVPAQDAATVQVWAGQTVVQHLYFRDLPQP